MARGTDKAGTAGRFGARYGVVVRNRVKTIEKAQKASHECPSCHHRTVKRVSSGIWECRRCGNKFAAGAYNPKVREVAVRTPKAIDEIPETSAE